MKIAVPLEGELVVRPEGVATVGEAAATNFEAGSWS